MGALIGKVGPVNAVHQNVDQESLNLGNRLLKISVDNGQLYDF